MRILVVEDEMISRLKLEAIMRTFGHCETAENGSQAVYKYQQALVQGKAYQLVMLDIEMPDMRGPQVLRQIRRIEGTGTRQAAVIMVTAQLSQNQVLSCIQEGCNDYIAKPFNINIIREKLLKLGIINGNGGNNPGHPRSKPTEVENIFNRVDELLRTRDLLLPPMPQIGIKFRELVREGAGMDKMAALLKKDVAIASQVIRLSNTASYCGFGKIQNLENAIGRLGLAETEKLVMSLSNQTLFITESLDPRKMLKNLWLHSLACAYGAEALTEILEINSPLDAYTAGLVHDIGAFALIHSITELQALGHFDGLLESETIDKTVREYHTTFGAKLLETWAFDPGYMKIALSHNNLKDVETVSTEIYLVHLSNVIAKSLGYAGCEPNRTVALSETESAQNLQVTSDQINMVQKVVQSQMAMVEQFVD